jgi:membrane protease YdiL (CAAX protease family)
VLRVYPGVSLAIFVVSVVIVAPLVEELLFRGLLLRAAMWRFGFWPGAFASSLFFGLAHAPGGVTWQSALFLTVMMTVFGLLQCVLVRRTGRLTPGIGVHATLNSLAAFLTIG